MGSDGPEVDVAGEVTRLLLRTADDLEAAAPDDPAFSALFGELRAFVSAGGKRLRPTFLWWGHRAGGGLDFGPVLPAAAAVELVHVCALVHDDVMDASPMRRGRATSHVAFATAHAAEGWSGDASHYGTSAAIMLGDLALVVADDLMLTTPLPRDRVRAAFDEFTAMRVEVVEGQFLDLVDGNRGKGDTTTALHIASLKTAKYTVERPLRMGARLAGAHEPVLEVLSRYGRAVGTAFQLRDDLLGAFGDAAVTGKPAGVDFREGKHTYLVARARELASPAQLTVLDSHLGDSGIGPDGVDRLRDVLAATGAVRECEARIHEMVSEASALIAGAASAVPPDACAALTRLAEEAAYREA